MSPRTRRLIPLLAQAALLSAGCHVSGPTQPEFAPPTNWSVEVPSEASTETLTDANWWTAFDDPTLTRLVDAALASSPTVTEALARLREAEAVRAVAGAQGRTTADVSAGRSRLETGNASADRYELGLIVGREVDLFGRIENAQLAAEADLKSAQLAQDEAILALIEGVALSYLDLREADARHEVARSSASAQAELVDLTALRAASGVTQELDVLRSKASLESTRARIPALEAQATRARLRLGALVGWTGAQIDAELADAAHATTQALPRTELDVAIGLPATLLQRRPDVRRAEAAIAAQAARVGAAEAELYPNLTFSGLLDFVSPELGDLFSSDNRTIQAGPTVRWTLFASGRLRAQVRAEEARWEGTLARFEQTILNAFEEVEGLLVSFAREQQRFELLRSAANNARQATRLATAQYESGVVDFEIVLESQRAELDLDDQRTLSRVACAATYVQLMTALGVVPNSWQTAGS